MLGWAVAIAIGMLVVYGLYPYNSPNEGWYKPMDTDLGAFYESCHRFAWGLALAWVILACVTGYGGKCHQRINLQSINPKA